MHHVKELNEEKDKLLFQYVEAVCEWMDEHQIGDVLLTTDLCFP